jgi:hypothetical protein
MSSRGLGGNLRDSIKSSSIFLAVTHHWSSTVFDYVGKRKTKLYNSNTITMDALHNVHITTKLVILTLSKSNTEIESKA